MVVLVNVNGKVCGYTDVYCKILSLSIHLKIWEAKGM